ncbi:uncharacterized protein LOC124556386 [Schistocerca americana]|uniref:uncharacterized protein LOC124556386 n=1 Tax=Schistocerca americana TaxID=7009 RepID=UPI001F50058B|nr:uncharacterized protein LOC124556386 [Schistocerca americana]
MALGKDVETIAELITMLEKRNCVNDKMESVLEENFSCFPLEFIVTHLKNSGAKKQSSILQDLVSSVNCEPDYLQEVFKYLKHNDSDKRYLKESVLIFDSMSVRKHIVSKKNCAGYVDLSNIVNTDAGELATEALVFQIRSYTEMFKSPIVYIFVNKLYSDVINEIVTVCILTVGVLARSVTCDGADVNIQALNAENFAPYFKHPANDCNVHAILHTLCRLKLVCNTLVAKKTINYEAGDCDNLKFANSLSGSHVNLRSKKINVSLAAQTVSCSVADSIELLESSQHPDFQDASATVGFTRIIDKLFDVCSSRNVHPKGFQKPIEN